MTTAEKEYFKQIPVWTAGYPFFPDLYAAPPASYIPDQSKFGPVWMWQYTDRGNVSGISGGVDCNWIDPVFAAMLENVYPQEPTPPPVEKRLVIQLAGKGTVIIEGDVAYNVEEQ